MHIYKNQHNEDVPSVTTILKVINKDKLINWANMLGFRRINYENELNRTAAIGTLTHMMIESYITNGSGTLIGVPYDRAILNEARERYLTFEKYIIMNGINFNEPITEKTFVCEQFGGTIDCLAYINGVYTLMDFKTSKKIYDSHLIQLGGYLLLIYMADKELYNKIEQCMIMAVTGKRTVYTEVLSKDDMQKYAWVFVQAYKLYTALQKLNNK